MDPNAGRFIEEERAEAWMARIEVGETIKIKGEELEVVEIGDRTVTLKLLSFEERMSRGLPSFADQEDAASREIERQLKKMLKYQR